MPTELPRNAPGLRALLPHWGWVALFASGSGVLAWFFAGDILFGKIVSVAPLQRMEFVQTLVASGHIETPFRVSIGAQITGVVTSVPVSEGDNVLAGATLLTLDDRESKATASQAEAQVAQAEARTRQIRELTLPTAEQSLAQLKATLLNAQQSYDRVSKLTASGTSTRVALDEATKVLDVTRAQVRNAELVVFTNRPDGSDYIFAENQLSQARATLLAAQTRMAYSVLKAPRDGVLIARDVEVGNVVQPGKELMRLSPNGDAQIVLQIDEKNLGLIRIGEQALASADAYGGETFPAEVQFINPAVDLQRASVEVKLKIPTPPAYLRADMTVSVDIEIARRPNALVISVADIRDIAIGKPWVLKAIDGHARRQPVTLGLMSAGKAEVLSGLAEGDQVVPAGARTVTDGSRLRLRQPERPRS